jgi:hypothetical protein
VETPAATRIPLDLARYAQQDADVALFQPSAPEEATQGKHNVVGIVTVQEPYLEQRAFQLLVHQLLPFRNRQGTWHHADVFLRGEEDLIATEEHSLGHIEGGIGWVGGNRHELMTEPHIIIGQAAVFRAKHQSDPVDRRHGHDMGRERACRQGAIPVQPGATGSAHHQPTIGDRAAERGVDLHRIEHVAGMDRHGVRLLTAEPRGVHQREVVDP